MKNIIVFGGDGFIGWPLSLRLVSLGYNVLIVDDFSRRQYDILHNLNSLVPIATPKERSSASGIDFINLSINNNYSELEIIFKKFKPDVVVHFAQQRSAPISMHSPEYRISTVNRNNSATTTICELVKNYNKSIKILHMGTMGVYGYSSSKIITEGYDKLNNLSSMNPGSIYHLTKCHDQLTFQLYKNLYGLDIIDLHQGIVWGSQTIDTVKNNFLFNRYDYDSMYGTVFNRFISQYAAGYPLTVYGDGLQKRGFIHIEDSVNSCINALNIKSLKKVYIANQFSELITVIDIAKKILATGLIKDHPGIDFIKNPRIESSSNFTAINKNWRRILNTTPVKINNNTILQELTHIRNYIEQFKNDIVKPVSNW